MQVSKTEDGAISLKKKIIIIISGAFSIRLLELVGWLVGLVGLLTITDDVTDGRD